MAILTNMPTVKNTRFKMSFSVLFPPLRGKCRRKAFGGPTMGVYKRHQIKSFWLRIWPSLPICLWKRIRGLKMSFSDLFPPLRGKCRRKAFGGPTMGVYKRHQIKSFWLRIWPFIPICLWKRIRGLTTYCAPKPILLF
jgi:hypothetical protein